ncbi:ALKBH8.2 family protein [Megaselia abdita]
MIPNKSYCFLECESIKDAELLFQSLHGKSTLGQNDSVLYLSYFVDIPNESFVDSKSLIPSGLVILKDFVDGEEEILLLKSVEFSENEENQTLKHRSVKHFGYEFMYGTNNVDPENPLDKKIPKECDFLWKRLKEKSLPMEWEFPDQMTVNEYLPGQGIPPHVDTHSAFLDPIVSLSLQSDIVMEFRKGNMKAEILVPKRSLLLMTGEARYDWTHGITPRHMDVILTENRTLTTANRSKRTSLTFRRLRRGACSCSFPRLCDSRKEPIKESVDLEEVAAKLETENVHNVYDQIASHFSETRHSPWPQVAEFLNSFDQSDVLLDVGCGNGKYLNVNKELMSVSIFCFY